MPIVYDLESFPNVFTACFKPVGEPGGVLFEISDRRRDNAALWHYVAKADKLIGFNNMGFDWPLLAHFMENPNCDAEALYQKCQRLIGGDRFTNTIWNPTIPQIDLYLIHHFNNRAKSTSLKKLQFNMRSEKVQELPFEVGTHLSDDEIDVLLRYNAHDVLQTEKFYLASRDKIELREAIEPDWMNQSDTGLGRKYFIRELEGAGVRTRYFDEAAGRSMPVITMRPEGVRLADVIFPYIRFHTPVLAAALDFYKRLTVVDVFEETGKAKRLGYLDGRVVVAEDGDGETIQSYEFELDGITITMGYGGIHGSLNRKLVEGCDILDLDVTSFYPSISIQNQVFPAHLGPAFCAVYQQLLDRRLQTAKGTPENTAIKLALNSVFGSAGSIHTPFYDPAAMLGITVNGQFLILSLAELLLTVPGLRLIQLNTDGITVIVPPGKRGEVEALYKAWSEATRMPLESAEYRRLWIRDCNNYIAEKLDGKRKRKGAYQPEKDWHQNASMPVVRMAAEAEMCDGVDVESFISRHADVNPWDFLLRLNLSRTSYLQLDNGQRQHGVVRYFVSENGHSAVKVMPKTRTRIHGKGHAECTGKRGEWTCTACGQVFKTKKEWEAHADSEHASKLVLVQAYAGEPIDYDMRFYAGEARKLIISEKFNVE